MAPANIHQSPYREMKIELNVRKLPPDNNTTIPLIQIIIPKIRSGIFSLLENMAASRIANTGDDVVPIRARLMAGE